MRLCSCVLLLNESLVIISKHVGALTVVYKLQIVVLQTLDNVAILLRAHLRQLKEGEKQIVSFLVTQDRAGYF